MPGFWQDELMREEPLLFVKQPGTPPSGTLLFRVRKISRVTDTAGRIEYREGRDFRLGPDRRRITLTPESRLDLRAGREAAGPGRKGADPRAGLPEFASGIQAGGSASAG